MADICPKLKLSGLGGDGFYNLRGSAGSQSKPAVENHSPQSEIQFCTFNNPSR